MGLAEERLRCSSTMGKEGEENGMQLVRTFLKKWENFHVSEPCTGKADGLESISRRDGGFSSENRGLMSLGFKAPTENPETAPQLLLEDDRSAGSHPSSTALTLGEQFKETW